MRQMAPLELPPRIDHSKMIHYLRPPFPQIPPDDMLNIIKTATHQNPSPSHDNELPPHDQEQSS